MKRPKHFSFLWAFLWFLVFGVGIVVYLVWHWAKRDRYAYLRLEGDRLVVSESRGFLGTLFAPVAAYFKWAAKHEQAWAKVLALGGPVVAVLMIIIVAAAASGGGQNEEGSQPAVAAQPSSATAAESGRTAEAQPTSTTAPQPSPTAAQTPQSERIVGAAPGTIGQAEGVRVTLNNVADPWVSPATFAPDTPDAGKRFVAFDITIEYTKDGGSHYGCWTGFKLTDVDGYAYDYQLLFDLEPTLDCVDLGTGQKTRGWVGFEVNEGTRLDLLKYDPNMFSTKDIEFHFQ